MQVVQVFEKKNRFFLFKDGEEYRTVVQNTISSTDKGLVEAIARKINEGKPNLVKLYLRKFDIQGLIDIINDLRTNDKWSSRLPSTRTSEFFGLFKESQLRKLIDVYSECGDVGIAFDIGTIDTEDYDWFGAGMAASSGLCMDPVADYVYMVADILCDEDEDVYANISEEDFVKMAWKHADYLLPKGPKARSKFFDLLLDF